MVEVEGKGGSHNWVELDAFGMCSAFRFLTPRPLSSSQDYYSADNSCINKVVERRVGGWRVGRE